MPQPDMIATPFNYDHVQLSKLLQQTLQAQLSAEAVNWLQEKVAALNEPKSNALAVAFSAMPRKTGKAHIMIAQQTQEQIESLWPGMMFNQWTIDRLCRVWLLLQVDASDKEIYLRRIEQLFPAAEMNELVALYAALPLLAYPEAWCGRCAEGIRSNIGPVLEAIICNNPYPSGHLPEGAWNQLVLKAFFTEKRVDQIIGLDKRANPELAQILIDFSRERRAAGRPVPPLLWRCVAPFIDETNFADLKMAFVSINSDERDAAALACAHSSYAPAKDLLATNTQTAGAIQKGELSWSSLGERVA
jgi:hypothetical protein